MYMSVHVVINNWRLFSYQLYMLTTQQISHLRVLNILQAENIQSVHNTMGRRIVLINMNVGSIADTAISIVIVVIVIVMWERRIAQMDIIHAMYKLVLICHHHNRLKIKVLVLTTICVMPTLLVMNMILHQLKVNIPNR